MPASPRPTSKFSPALAGLILCALTALFLTFSFAPFYVWPLAFVALVPFSVCIIRRPLKFRWISLYYLAGGMFFLPNMYWFPPEALIGAVVLVFFLALYFVLYAFIFHRLVVDLRVPGTFALPLAWLSVEFARTTFIEGGFPFFHLGNVLAPNNSFLQTPSLLLLQSADLLGVWLLTFLLATVNGFILDVLRLPLVSARTGKANRPLLNLGLYTLVLLVAAFVYGGFRLHQSTTHPGPKLAVVQKSIPQELKDNSANFERLFSDHLELTRQAIAAERPDLVAWPETMVPYPFNREILAEPARIERVLRLSPPRDPEELAWLKDRLEAFRELGDAYDRLVQTIHGTRTALLVGVADRDLRTDDQRNTSVLLLPERGEVERYAKRHLVPFGEYVPFSTKGTKFRQFLLNLTPLKYDYSITPGTAWTHFELAVPARQRSGGTDSFYFSTPICFEDLMPEPARAMAAVRAGDGQKGVDFLINISNDGWFRPAELDLHLQACQLRAVENRVPIARSVNMGNSGFIDSCGRVTTLVRDESGRSIGASGWVAQTLALDLRVTVYSRVGDILPIAGGIITVLLVGWTFVRPRRSGRNPRGGSAS